MRSAQDRVAGPGQQSSDFLVTDVTDGFSLRRELNGRGSLQAKCQRHGMWKPGTEVPGKPRQIQRVRSGTARWLTPILTFDSLRLQHQASPEFHPRKLRESSRCISFELEKITTFRAVRQRYSQSRSPPISLPASLPLAKAMQLLKANSSRWLGKHRIRFCMARGLCGVQRERIQHRGGQATIKVTSPEPVNVMVSKNGNDKLIARLVYSGPIRAPFAAGQKVGMVRVWRGGNVAMETRSTRPKRSAGSTCGAPSTAWANSRSGCSAPGREAVTMARRRSKSPPDADVSYPLRAAKDGKIHANQEVGGTA